jgi:hypothetical protein
LINKLLNAKGIAAALSSCYLEMRNRDAEDKWKTGRDLEKARKLRDDVNATGLTFKDLVPRVLKFHAPIAHYLEGGDMGIKLMNHDGRIALEVMTAFAKRAIPCLGCHDSFIVPLRYREDLRETMMRVYKKRLGFWPVVKE